MILIKRVLWLAEHLARTTNNIGDTVANTLAAFAAEEATDGTDATVLGGPASPQTEDTTLLMRVLNVVDGGLCGEFDRHGVFADRLLVDCGGGHGVSMRCV